MKQRIILILFLVFPMLILAQTSNNNLVQKEEFYRPPGGIRVILGFSGIFGIRYGASIFITNKWSLEFAQGRNIDINFGGGKYDMILTGVVANRYFPLEREMAIVASILYSYANVIQKSSEYTGDFNTLTPMVGLDYSAKSGFGFFLRGGVIFATENYQNGSGKFKADIGICWRFDFFF